MMKDEIDLTMDYPSRIAGMLLTDEIDVGLVPISIIPEIKEYHILSDYCIGCNGETGSVGLFSDVPLPQIQRILLDYQSRTSVELLKLLVREYWKIDPIIEITSREYQHRITGSTAGLVIGDRAFEQRKISPHIFDLGLEWKKFTGMPFVFAVWLSNKKPEESFAESFNKATAAGLHNIDKIVSDNSYTLFDLKAYYTSYINYHLDESKKKAMHFFLQKCFSGVLTAIE